MRIIDILEADGKTSEFAERVAKGETLTIAKAGKPLAKVTPLDPSPRMEPRRRGFLAGAGTVPEDFDRLGEREIWAIFSEQKLGAAQHSSRRARQNPL